MDGCRTLQSTIFDVSPRATERGHQQHQPMTVESFLNNFEDLLMDSTYPCAVDLDLAINNTILWQSMSTKGVKCSRWILFVLPHRKNAPYSRTLRRQPKEQRTTQVKAHATPCIFAGSDSSQKLNLRKSFRAGTVFLLTRTMAPFGSSDERAALIASGDDDSSEVHPVLRTLQIILASAFAVLFLVCAIETAYVIPPGMIGVVVTLGHVDARRSGLHFRIPMVSSVEIMSTKTQLLEEKNVIPTKEGLAVTLDTAILFRLDPTKTAELYQQVGADYINVLIKPEASSAVRGLTSESEAKALYSSGRTIIQDSLKTELEQKLGPRGIIVEDVLLKDIILPEQLSKSIELKVQAEQEAARMEFVLNTERQEAERKAIEAAGIADFQRIVSEGISPELLKWKGVEATEKFAGSLNTKIIIMGNSGSDLPVILSTDD